MTRFIVLTWTLFFFCGINQIIAAVEDGKKDVIYAGNFFDDVLNAVGEGVKQGINEGLKSNSKKRDTAESETQQDESTGRQRKSITDMSTGDSESNANPLVSPAKTTSVSDFNNQYIHDVIEFDVPPGKTVNGFTYAQNGILLYKGKKLCPSVMVNANYIEKYQISILRSKNLAAAIAVDDANKNILNLIDLNKGTSSQIPPDGISTAVKIYWSPSKRYMVALCLYEGERFISIDLNTNKINDGDFIGPPNKAANKIWRIKNMPRWIGTTDVLVFTVDEKCNYYDNPDCGIDKILATYDVRLDAASLEMQFDKAATNTEVPHSNIGTDSIKVGSPLLSSYMKESNISLEYCGKNTDLKSNRNIHNGIDISVPSGQSVQSICAGKVVLDHTTDAALSKYSNDSKYPDCKNNLDSCKYWNSFLILEHNCDGQKLYAYYGHVLSSVNTPNDIEVGDQIAVIRHDKSGGIPDHLHLSISMGKEWDRYGWGYDLLCKDADDAGYKDPLKYLKFTEGSTDNVRDTPIVSSASDADVVSHGNEGTIDSLVTSFSKRLQNLPIGQRNDALDNGRFEVRRIETPNKDRWNGVIVDYEIAYMIRNKNMFKEIIRDGFSGTDGLSIKSLNTSSGNGFFIALIYGASGGRENDYIIFPEANRFRYLYIEGYSVVIENLDSDAEEEIIIFNLPDFFDFQSQCNFCSACLPYWPTAYHFNFKSLKLIDVSYKFPGYYNSLASRYREYYANGGNWANESSACRENYKKLINKAESMARR